MSGPTWTPAPRPGLVPLHPLGFGTILGKSFAALRHNPKVLFGFAVVMQVVVVLVTSAVLVSVTFAAFSRLFTLRMGSDEYTTVAIGSSALVLVAGLVVGLGSAAFTSLVQGVVAADVGEAVLGGKATLRALWSRVRPAAWRLIGYSLLVMVAVTAAVLLIGLVMVGGIGLLGGFSDAAMTIGVVGTVLGFLALVPLLVWLGTKLLLVPSVLVLEHQPLRQAVVRSWRLTRGRFWVAFGVTAIIGVIMYTAAQVVGVPVSLLMSIVAPLIAPTGSDVSAAALTFLLPILLTQIVVMVVNAVSTVVQSTGAALVYLDCRMRHEGLDQDLMAAAERRQAGLPAGADPFVIDPARAVAKEYRPLAKTVWDAPRYPAPPQGQPYPGQPYPVPAPQYPGQPYPAQPYPAPGQPYPAQPYPTPDQQHRAPAPPAPAAPPAAPVHPAPPVTSTDAAPPIAPDRGWAAPGSGGSGPA